MASVEMIIVDKLSFIFVEKEGLKNFINQAQLLFQIISHGNIVDALACDDLANVRSAVKFHEIFYEITIKVSGSHYATSNVHFKDTWELDVYLKLC
ncbi:hypothetical protein H5410_015381 [Solanum commersonii]|uniref:Uncharacterized protein n=1 Tax=Solanum commersonii TaxID=4109 RepID=A0A9J5ZTC7_SOLCO|nr:hypothetical protein H5410_015381 [Solanum commersonii]